MIAQGFRGAKGRAVRDAIDGGDRSIDTAQAYGNGAGGGGEEERRKARQDPAGMTRVGSRGPAKETLLPAFFKKKEDVR